MLIPEAPTAHHIVEQLRELYLERALAKVTGLDTDRPYMADLEQDIADHRLAATRACIARRTLGSDDNAIADIVATLRDHGSGPW